MRWQDTVAATCRWTDAALIALSDALAVDEDRLDLDVIWENSESDYQGSVEVLARYEWDNKRIALLVYNYGSCSGCDSYEGSTILAIAQRLRQESISVFPDPQSAIKYFKSIKDKEETDGWDEERPAKLQQAIEVLTKLVEEH
jgi:hypothetical protein